MISKIVDSGFGKHQIIFQWGKQGLLSKASHKDGE